MWRHPDIWRHQIVPRSERWRSRATTIPFGRSLCFVYTSGAADAEPREGREEASAGKQPRRRTVANLLNGTGVAEEKTGLARSFVVEDTRFLSATRPLLQPRSSGRATEKFPANTQLRSSSSRARNSEWHEAAIPKAIVRPKLFPSYEGSPQLLFSNPCVKVYFFKEARGSSLGSDVIRTCAPAENTRFTEKGERLR